MSQDVVKEIFMKSDNKKDIKVVIMFNKHVFGINDANEAMNYFGLNKHTNAL